MRFLAVLFTLLATGGPLFAAVQVDPSNPTFAALAETEIAAMREGKRGMVCRTLLQRLDVAAATTTVRALTLDESTWHPNDLKGTRSHVVPLDTLMRGAERVRPTDAEVYINASRIDPTVSLYKLGSFVQQLAIAADLNDGVFSADYRLREKRASFYRNAWLDSLALKPIAVSDRVPTPDYAKAKEKGLLIEENAAQFPILDGVSFKH